MSAKKSDFRTISDETVRKKTGKGWTEWFGILDGVSIKGKGHTPTAKHLRRYYGPSS